MRAASAAPALPTDAVRLIGAAPGRRYPRAMGSFNVALLEALLSAGVSLERARALVEQFERAVDERYSLHAQVLATKRGLAEMATRLAREIAAGKVDLAKWAVASLTAQTAPLLGASKLL